MLTTLNIASLDQGKTTSKNEDEYYRSAAGWRVPAWLGRLVARLRAPREAATPLAARHAAEAGR
jgi:hypothetical protein